MNVFDKNRARFKQIPVYEELALKLFYNRKTGELTSRGNLLYGKAGNPVGRVAENGQIWVGVNYLQFKLQDIAHMLMRKSWPQNDMPCRDGNLLNNKWSNIRPISDKEAGVLLSKQPKIDWANEPWQLKHLI